jgi:AraC-like DNA-binding protein
MPRSRKDVPVPHHLVPALIRLLRRRGVDAARFVRRFALPGDVEERADALVTAAEFGAILAAAGEALGDPFVALRLPAELELRRYNFAEMAATASPTYRDALGRLVRYASLVNRQVVFGLEESGDEVRWTQRTIGHPRGVGREANEFAIATAVTHLRAMRGDTFAPRRVWFQHSRPRDVRPLRAFFGTDELGFDARENGMAFDRVLLDLPLPTADPRLLATADQLAENALSEAPPARDFLAMVAERVRQRLRAGPADVEGVARTMRMSPRTLHRRLEECGATFSEVVDRERGAAARAYLKEKGLPLAEVAQRLGFSDAASFGRAFKRWTGTSPGAYRRG